MIAIKALLKEALTMIDISDEQLDYIVIALDKLKIGTVLEYEVVPDPDEPSIHLEKMRYVMLIRDDVGSAFELYLDKNGYCHEIKKLDKDNDVTWVFGVTPAPGDPDPFR